MTTRITKGSVRGRFHCFTIDTLVEMLARAGIKVHLTTARGHRVA